MKVFSSVIGRLLRPKAEHRVTEGRRLASRAWTSTGSLPGHNYFCTEVDRLNLENICFTSPRHLHWFILLLRSFSKPFEDQSKYGTVTNVHELHCLSITLGIQSRSRRSLITMYGRELIEMQKISKDSPIPLDRFSLLLDSVSKLFKEEQLEYGAVTAGHQLKMNQIYCPRMQGHQLNMSQLYCLSMKLGFESNTHPSRAWNSTVSPNFFTKLQILDMVMLKVFRQTALYANPTTILLWLASTLFEVHCDYRDVTTGKPILCLAITLGHELHFRMRRGLADRRVLAQLSSNPNSFSKIDALCRETVMRKINKESSKPLPRLMLLLQSVSELFETHFDYGHGITGQILHCLTIKLGIETHNHRNLITLYGKEIEHHKSLRKVFNSIPRGFFYKSLNSMVHAFAHMRLREAHAAFGMIIRLGFPSIGNISGFLVALRNKSCKTGNTSYVINGAKSMVLLMNHYGIPPHPKIVGGFVEMYVANGLVSVALEMIIGFTKIDRRLIDDPVILSFLKGCVDYEDMESASAMVRHLENTGIKYTLDEAMVRRLKEVKFGKHLIIESNVPGISFLDGNVKKLV